MHMPISKELCAKLDLPIERWGTIRSAVAHWCDTPNDWLRKAALEDAQDDEEFMVCSMPRLEFSQVCETDLPPEVMSIARDVQRVRPLTDAQAVTYVVEVVRSCIRTSHVLDSKP